MASQHDIGTFPALPANGQLSAPTQDAPQVVPSATPPTSRAIEAPPTAVSRAEDAKLGASSECGLNVQAEAVLPGAPPLSAIPAPGAAAPPTTGKLTRVFGGEAKDFEGATRSFGAPAPPMVPSAFVDLRMGPSPAPGAALPTASTLLPSPVTQSSKMPPAMEEYLQQLENWALANEKDSRKDSFKFWSFKIPGIVAATGSGLFAAIHLPSLASLLIGLIGGLCVALDGILRPGKLRSVHIRALHDLRNLENVVRNQWLMATLEGRNSNSLAAKILGDAENKRLKIGAYLEAVEAAPLDSVVAAPGHDGKLLQI